MSTLIVYATKYGSVEKCAKMLAEQMTGKIDLINLKSKDLIKLSEYDKVIIGGSIYVGKIQKEVSTFCLKNLGELKGKKLGLFICCMQKGEYADRQMESSFPEELFERASVRSVFGGEFQFKKMNILERFMVNKISKVDTNYPPVDTKEDISTISTEIIKDFARLMNNA